MTAHVRTTLCAVQRCSVRVIAACASTSCTTMHVLDSDGTWGRGWVNAAWKHALDTYSTSTHVHARIHALESSDHTQYTCSTQIFGARAGVCPVMWFSTLLQLSAAPAACWLSRCVLKFHFLVRPNGRGCQIRDHKIGSTVHGNYQPRS